MPLYFVLCIYYALIMRMNKADLNTFAQDIKRVRQYMGLSQCQLANKMGVNQATISRVERGMIPRDGLRYRLENFVNQGKKDDVTDVLERIKNSPELRSLVDRVLKEVNA